MRPPLTETQDRPRKAERKKDKPVRHAITPPQVPFDIALGKKLSKKEQEEVARRRREQLKGTEIGLVTLGFRPDPPKDQPRQGEAMATAKAQEAPHTTTVTNEGTRRQASRINKTSFSFWLDPEFKRGLFMLKAQDPSRTLEDFCAEAFNDLFSKHGMPTVPATPEPQAQKPRGPKRSPG